MAQLLYFAALAERLGRTAEEVPLPASARDVRTLLAWLRGRGGAWEAQFADDAANVTVKPVVQGSTAYGAEGHKRQFAAPDTPVDDRAEVALRPARRR